MVDYNEALKIFDEVEKNPVKQAPDPSMMEGFGEKRLSPSEVLQAFESVEPEQGYLETIGKGIVRGAEGMASGAGSVLNWAGEVAGSEPIARAGKNVTEYFDKAAREGWAAPDPNVFRGEFMDNPSFKRAAGIISEAAASLGGALALGGGVGLGVRALGAGVRAASIAGKTAAAGGLGLLEGAPQYGEAREAGKSIGEASAMGAASTIGTGLLEFLAIDRFLKPLKGTIGQVAKKAVTEFGPVESAQEVAQTFWQNLIARFGYDETRSLTEGMIEAAIGGFGAGAISGTAGHVGNQKIKDFIDRQRQKGVPDQEISDTIEHVGENVTQAMDQKADEVAQKPVNDEIAQGADEILRQAETPEIDPVAVAMGQPVEEFRQPSADTGEAMREEFAQPEDAGQKQLTPEEVLAAFEEPAPIQTAETQPVETPPIAETQTEPQAPPLAGPREEPPAAAGPPIEPTTPIAPLPEGPQTPPAPAPAAAEAVAEAPEEATTAEVAPNGPPVRPGGVDVSQDEWIKKRVDQLGSVAAVSQLYSGNSPVEKYARALAEFKYQGQPAAAAKAPESAKVAAEAESKPAVPEKGEKFKGTAGWAFINDQQRPITTARGITKGKNKGKFLVTVGNEKRQRMIPADAIRQMPVAAAASEPDLTYKQLNQQVKDYQGKGGISSEVKIKGLVPAFKDNETGRTYEAKDGDGNPAGVHLLDGLPADVVTQRNDQNEPIAVKGSIVPGFMKDGKFYTRDEAAKLTETPKPYSEEMKARADEQYSGWKGRESAPETLADRSKVAGPKWTAFTPEQREAIAKQIWATQKGNLSPVGRKIAKSSWEKLSPAAQRLISAKILGEADAAAPAAPEAAVGTQQPKATDYISKIKSPGKKEYAQKYLNYILEGREGDSPEAGDISYMAAQAVRMQLDSMVEAAPATKTKSAPKPKKPKAPPSAKAPKITTLRGAIKKLGGLNVGNFKGEFKDADQGAQRLRNKNGFPLDLAEQQLKEDGWLSQDENLIDVLRDPASLRRNKVAGEGVEKREQDKTEAEKKFEKEMAWEPEIPEGEYVDIAAEDLPEGRKLTIIDDSRDGYDIYEVVEKDPFGVVLKDGTTITLSPGQKVSVRQEDLPESVAKEAEAEAAPKKELHRHWKTQDGKIVVVQQGPDKAGGWTFYAKSDTVRLTDRGTRIRGRGQRLWFDTEAEALDALQDYAPGRGWTPVKAAEQPRKIPTPQEKTRQMIEAAAAKEDGKPNKIEYQNLTAEEAGKLSEEDAEGMLGPWWFGNEGREKLGTEEGRQSVHRVWLRNTFNSNPEDIPLNVLKSHALDKPAYNAHDWFSRELWNRQQKEAEKPEAEKAEAQKAEKPDFTRTINWMGKEVEVPYFVINKEVQLHPSSKNTKVIHSVIKTINKDNYRISVIEQEDGSRYVNVEKGIDENGSLSRVDVRFEWVPSGRWEDVRSIRNAAESLHKQFPKEQQDLFAEAQKTEPEKPALVLEGEKAMPKTQAELRTRGKQMGTAQQGGLEFGAPETPAELTLTGEKVGAVEAVAAKKIMGELAKPKEKDIPIPDESELVSTKEVNEWERSHYVKDGGVFASSREKPMQLYPWGEGTWRVDEHFGIYGRMVEQIRRVPLSEIALSEEDYTKSNNEGRGFDAEQYAKWMKEGKTPPPVLVVETDTGAALVSDGHRRVAAAKLAGADSILAWVSPRMDTGKKDSAGKPIYTAATYEGLKFGVPEASKMYDERQAKLMGKKQAPEWSSKTDKENKTVHSLAGKGSVSEDGAGGFQAFDAKGKIIGTGEIVEPFKTLEEAKKAVEAGEKANKQTLASKEPWQMTRAEFTFYENKPKVDAIQKAIKNGKRIALSTQYKVIPLRRADHIRIFSDSGNVQVPEGTKWVSLTGDQIDMLAAQAGFELPILPEKVYHHAEVEKALAEGKPVPAEVLADYPDLEKPATGTGEKIEDFGEKVGGARKDIAERGFTMTKGKKEDSEPAWKKQFKAMESVREPGRWSVVMVSKDRWGSRNMPQKFDSLEEAEKALPLFAVAMKFQVREKQTGEFIIEKKVGERKRLQMVQKPFESREEAMKYMAAHAEELLNTKTSFGEEILPVPDKVKRKGAERRQGPATREMFIETFAPRAIEFGNWNNQEERQLVMNHAYDGLLDLADALGVPPKALMLNGELAIAFGARGQGLVGAKAHYEPDYGIINLTKMKGAGSLAHEWLHAFDHHLARLDTKAISEKVANKRGDMVFPDQARKYQFQSHGPSYKSKMRPELKKAYDNLIESMLKKAEQYVEDTQRADQFLATARKQLRESLDAVRSELAADRTNYAKAKGGWRRSEKGLHPAAADQLAEFDRLADLLVEGGDVATEIKHTEPKPTRGRRISFGHAYRTNATIDAISGIYKTVRNQTGRNEKGYGQVDRIASAAQTYSERLKMFEDAKAGTEKTKKVPTDYAIEARKMDQARVGDYWSEPHEMVARAFAAYVEDKIAEQGGQSDFLVYHAHGGIILPMIDGFVARPYPEGKEREAINKAFDEFVKTIKVEETDKGVTMFAMGAAPGTSVEKRALGVQKANVEAIKRLVPVVERSMREAGLPQDVIDLVRIDLKPIIDLDGKDVDQTLADWVKEGKDMSAILGATTVRRWSALMELSLEQDLNSLQKTTYHESFHIAARWLLPESDYQRLMQHYQTEEGAAEAFADFVARRSGGRPAPVGALRRAFLKLRRLLQQVGNFLRGQGFSRPQDIFGQIQVGAYKPHFGRGVEGGATTTALKSEDRAPVWYSQMEKFLGQKLPGSGTAKSYTAAIDSWARKGEYKTEELEWSGLREWLAEQNGKVTKQQVLDYLAENNVQVQEVLKGGDEHTFKGFMGLEFEGDGTIYSNYQTPGGENYRELLLTLPVPKPQPLKAEAKAEHDAISKEWYTATPERRTEIEQRRAELEKPIFPSDNAFRSSHYQEPNILAHIRFNERTDADGKRVLFIEEVQSDWAQKGRKEGFKTGKEKFKVDQSADDLWFIKTEDGQVLWTGYQTRELAEADAVDYARMGITPNSKVPDAPFVKDTGKWSMLAMKRMVRYAAENGFDRIAWTTGEMQAERYDLSKQIDSLQYSYQSPTHVLISAIKGGDEINVPGMTGMEIPLAEVEKYVGKEVANKISNKEGKPLGVYVGGADETLRELSGVDLKVGGEGMKGFYDKILPAEVNRFFGKEAWGKARVGEIYIPTLKDSKFQKEVSIYKDEGRGGNNGWMITNGSYLYGPYETKGEAIIKGRKSGWIEDSKESVHSLDITPQMREKALTEGMTQFRKAEAAASVADEDSIIRKVMPAHTHERSRIAFKGVNTGRVIDKIGEGLKTFAKTFTPGREYISMDPKYFGKFYEILRNFKATKQYADRTALDKLREILDPKNMTKKDYELFTLKIALEDLSRELGENGKYANWEGMVEKYGSLQFGFKSAAEVDEALEKATRLVDGNETVKNALQRRDEITGELLQQVVDAKLLPATVLQDRRFFHHQVLEYLNDRFSTGTGASTFKVGKKGYQYGRIENVKDYSLAYIESEYEVMAHQINQIEKKKNFDELDKAANIARELKQQAKQVNYVAIVGGQENMNRINYLRRQIADLRSQGGLDSDEKKMLKEWAEEIRELDPTMPFRTKMAIGFSKLQKVLGMDVDEFGDVDSVDMAELAKLADSTDEAVSIPARSIFKAIGERNTFIKETLGGKFVTELDLARDRKPVEGSRGWMEWVPNPRSSWYLTGSIQDAIAQQIIAGSRELQESDIRPVLARGRDETWIIPAELAEALESDQFNIKQHDTIVSKVSEQALLAWKRWILINPMRIVKYNLNNTSGDFDIAHAYNPKIFKYVKQSAADLWRWHYDKDMSPALKAEFDKALRDEVIGSGMTVHDIPDIRNQEGLQQLMDAMGAGDRKALRYIQKFWQGSKNFTTWRENVLRLAAYRHFKDEIAAGKRVYGASIPAKVDAIEDDDRRAALLTRELIGDYGALSKGGQWLRRKAIPFYSWCVPDSTEILTRNGWKFRDELRIGELALTYNMEKRQTEWQPVLDVAAYPFDGDLVTLKNSFGFKYQFTEDHRVVVIEKYKDQRKIVLAKDLKTHHHIPVVAPHEFPGESILPEKDAALLGWLVTDGYFRVRKKSPNSFEAMLYQKKPAEVEKIRREFADYISTESVHSDTGVICFRLKAAKLEKIRSVFKSKDRLPAIVTRLGRAECQAMYDAMLAAEGTVANRAVAFPQNNGPVLDAFQILCYMLGKAGHIRPKTAGGKLQHSLYVKGRDKIQLYKWKNTREHYTGTVWCPKTENGTWVMRQNGKVMITGNCEINAPRYYRMYSNLAVEGEPDGRKLRMGAVAAKKGLFLSAKVFALYAAAQMFNHLFWPDEEEELGETGRRQAHLILGRREDGTIITLRLQGALSDALSWFNLHDFPEDMRELATGKKSIYKWLAEGAVEPANKMIQGVRPDIKMAGEVMTGRKLYPEFWNPRPIRDKVEHVASSLSLDSLYRRAAGKPIRGGTVEQRVLSDILSVFTYSADPAETAYYQSRDLVADYLKEHNLERPLADPTNRVNALYYYKQAIKFGDAKAAEKYLKKYKELGGNTKGIQMSVKRAHPLGSLPNAHRARFFNSLDSEDRQTIRRGTQWYRETYKGGMAA